MLVEGNQPYLVPHLFIISVSRVLRLLSQPLPVIYSVLNYSADQTISDLAMDHSFKLAPGTA